MPPLYLCEYLPRLKKVSVHIELEKRYEKLKNISLNGLTLTLAFAVSSPQSPIEQVSIPLPCSNSDSLKDAQIQNIVTQNGTLILTIALVNDERPPEAANFMGFSNSNNIWSVKDLLKKTPRNAEGANEFLFLCQNCDQTLLSSVSYKFVDMPLEFWHEMMDFWHCHKPHEEHHNHNEKSYDGKIVPRPGFVNIGASYLQVAGFHDPHCKNCNVSLGALDGDVLQIYKWRLKLAYDGKIEDYLPYLFVYFALLDKINSSGTRKFALTTADSEEQLSVWVTGVGLDVTFGENYLPDCLKILYRRDDADIEDILVIPQAAWDSFKEHLAQIEVMLPRLQRTVHMVEAEEKVEYGMSFLSSKALT